MLFFKLCILFGQLKTEKFHIGTGFVKIIKIFFSVKYQFTMTIICQFISAYQSTQQINNNLSFK